MGAGNADRVRVVHDDGRHFVCTSPQKFDIITTDLIDPWIKGCAALNTLEYYTICRDHLNPGGVMALWIPLYESEPDTLRSLVATFFDVFPNGILWTNDVDGEGYDAVLFGQVGPTVINLDQLEARLNRPDHRLVRQSLADVGFQSVYELLATYAGQASRLRSWSSGAEINTDRNLRLQYLAGMSLNSYMGTELLDGILRHYKFPERVFTGSEGSLQALKWEIAATGRMAQDR
jgi:spermidine synthase